ncbi:MAG: glycosyltransferase family 4 protein [Candidatus Promineifilaceae bacterium]
MSKICILSSVHIALDNRVFYREAQSLARNGYDVTLIAVHDKSEVKDGVQIVGLPKVPRRQRPHLWLELYKQAKATQADIYHFHDPELLLVTPWLRWRTGKPTIYDIHEVYPDFIKVKDYLPAWLRYPIAWTFRWLEPLLARLQSGLIFSDYEIAKPFEKIKKPKTTLFNFPSVEFVQTAAANTKREGRKPAVLYLGGMERNRGTALMIEAFAQLLEQYPSARLLLVGHFMPPALEEEVWEAAARRGIESAVTITGRVPFEKIGEYLQEASVGWVSWQPVPKNEKNIPTKLFEYMAYGLPIVSSDLASTRPFIRNGEDGYLVTADDPTAHAQALLRLLNDPLKALEMGRQGQLLVQNEYNWGKMEKRLLILYEALLTP